MSKLLFDESPLVIQPSLAKIIGLNEAIVLQQIHYWLTRDKAGKEIDGVRWIYNSLSDWKEQFPFWSESTIYRALKSLEEMHLLKIGNFNQRKGDRTQWFTIAYDEVAFIESGGDRNSIFQDETAKSHNGTSSSQDETTLPETSPEISSETSQSLDPPRNPDDSGYGVFIKEISRRVRTLTPRIAEQAAELWDEYDDLEAHIFALDQTDKHASGFNLKYYEQCLSSWWAKHKFVSEKQSNGHLQANTRGARDGGNGSDERDDAPRRNLGTREPQSPLRNGAAQQIPRVPG